METWNGFWAWAESSTLGATVVGGVIVLVIGFLASVVVSRIRRVSIIDSLIHVLGKLFYAGEWLWEHRLRSNMRIVEAERDASIQVRGIASQAADNVARLKAEVLEEQARTTMHSDAATRYAEQLQASERDRASKSADSNALQQLYDTMKARLEDASARASLGETQIAELQRQNAALSKRLREATEMKDLLAQVEGIAPAPLPMPAPRWSIYFDVDGEDRNEYYIRNSVERSVANEVRLELVEGEFDFWDGAHWKSISGPKTESFRGELDASASYKSVAFRVSWYDERSVQFAETIRLTLWQSP